MPCAAARWQPVDCQPSRHSRDHGARDAKGNPLQIDTVMYGASITKTVMAYTALTLVDQGKLDLDAPLADYLERPLISLGGFERQSR